MGLPSGSSGSGGGGASFMGMGADPVGDLSALAGIYTSIKGAHDTKKANNRDRNAALNMWWASNLYNSPLAQRTRLEQAGLNPALMYGNGASTGNTSPTNLPETKVPDYSGIPKALSSYVDMKKTNADTQAMQKEIDVKNAQIDNLRANTAKTYVDSAKTSQDTMHSAGLYDDSLKQASANVAKTNADTRHTQQSIDNTDKMFPISKAAAETGVDLARQDYRSRALDIIKKRLDVRNYPKEVFLKIAQLSANVNATNRDNKIKDFEIMLNQMNLSKGDAAYLKFLVNSYFFNPDGPRQLKRSK